MQGDARPSLRNGQSMELALIRFFESLPSAVAVGLLLLPMLIGEDGRRFRFAVAGLGAFRALLGFALIAATARAIIPPPAPIDVATLGSFVTGTVVGKAWLATEALAVLFAFAAAARMAIDNLLLDRVALALGVLVIVVVSVTGHAVDDTLPIYTQASFLFHTGAGLTWLGGLLGLVYWMYTAKGKSPEVANRLAERWSLVAKIAMAVVVVSGLALALENVGSFANLLATPYGRLLTLKLVSLCFVLLAALILARYITHRPQTEFDTQWYAKVGVGESVFGVALLFLASWIAVITPASPETELFWPLPFRLSFAATWGFLGYALPSVTTPMWWTAPAWWGVAALVSAAIGLVFWIAPQLAAWRAPGAGGASVVAALCVAVSFATQAYPDTYNDPTVDYTAESVARGYDSFMANCTGCHGATGKGDGPMAKDLKDARGVATLPADLTAPHVGNHTIGDIFHWLTFGGQSGVMPGFKDTLDVDDRWDLINYLLMLSYTQRARDTLRPQPPLLQWLIAPDFALVDPTETVTTLSRLRGDKSTLVSFAHCNLQGDDEKALEESLAAAQEAAKSAGAHHVTVYFGDCPATVKGIEATHPKAVEKAYAVINRYPNEDVLTEIPQAHFLIDRSGYLRARFRAFARGDGSAALFAAHVATMAREPFVVISLHSH
jgi:copper transport protein